MLKLSNPDIAASCGALSPGFPRISSGAAALGALPQLQEPLQEPPPATVGQERLIPADPPRRPAQRAHRSRSAAHARPRPPRPCDVSTRRASTSGAVTSRMRTGKAAGRPPLGMRFPRHRPLPAWRPRSIALPWERGAGRREDGGRRWGVVVSWRSSCWARSAPCRRAAPRGPVLMFSSLPVRTEASELHFYFLPFCLKCEGKQNLGSQIYVTHLVVSMGRWSLNSLSPSRLCIAACTACRLWCRQSRADAS